MRCQCQYRGVVVSELDSFYDPVTEAPFRAHEPGECRCTNNLHLFLRDGRPTMLCSNCTINTDKELSQ